MAQDPEVLWGRAVDAGARGRYADADAILDRLSERAVRLPGNAAPAVLDRWASLALSTQASHRRQIGSPEAAVERDAQALSVAADAESRADALIGLAADAVALADADAARHQHARAETDAGIGWRTQTRWHWVGAELAMLESDHVSAHDHAQAAVVASRECSPRHEVKSQLILAAVTGDVTLLPEIALRIDEGDWITLAWPIALIAGDHAEDCDPAWLARMWSAGREATYAIEGALPVGLVGAWIAHPGVHRLRADGPPAGGE